MAEVMGRGPPYGNGSLPRKWVDLGYCVVRKVGNQASKHKDFRVRRDRVLAALRWLKANNPFYSDIEIDADTIAELPHDGDVSHLLPTDNDLGLMEPEARGPSETGHKVDVPEGDLSKEFLDECDRRDEWRPAPSSVSMQNVTKCRESVAKERTLNEITGDVDEGAAARRLEDPIAYPTHECIPFNEDTPGFLSMCYPALLPWGSPRSTGPDPHPYGADWKSDNRLTSVTKLEYFTHLLHYEDQRFAKHEVFRYEATASLSLSIGSVFFLQVFSAIHRERARGQSKAFLKTRKYDDLSREELAQKIKDKEGDVLADCLRFSGGSLRGTRHYWAQRRSEGNAWLYFLEKTYDIMPILFHTESAADTHWPHLQRQFTTNATTTATPAGQHDDEAKRDREDIAQRRKAVMDNPLLTAQYFVQFMRLLHHKVLEPAYGCTESLTRYEFQQRGMTHGHSVATFEGQPTITQIQNAFKRVDEEQAKSDSDSTKIFDVETIPEVKEIIEWVMKHLPVNAWLPPHLCPPEGEGKHAARRKGDECLKTKLSDILEGIPDDLLDVKLTEDSGQIKARCNVHSCTDYCTSAKPSVTGGEVQCRFGAPWTMECCTCAARDGNTPPPMQEASDEATCTNCQYKLLWNQVKKRWTLHVPRNHPQVTPTLPGLINACRANSDAQVILDQDALLTYIIKYQIKAEKRSSAYRETLKADLENPESHGGCSVKSMLEKLLNKSVGERDVGAIEVHHILEGLPLLECNRQFTYLHISGEREVTGRDVENDVTGETDRKVEVKDSAEDKYRKRDKIDENLEWYDYAASRMWPSGKVRDVRLHAVPVVKPWVNCHLPARPGEPPCSKHELYCRQRLLIHIPWRVHPEECSCREGDADISACKCVLKGRATCADAFKFYKEEGNLPKVVIREFSRKVEERHDKEKADEDAKKTQEICGEDEQNRSKLDAMVYMDDEIKEDKRLKARAEEKLEDWMELYRGNIDEHGDPPLRNYDPERHWEGSGDEFADAMEANLYPGSGKKDWIEVQSGEDEVDQTWAGLDSIDLNALDTDPKQGKQKAAVALVLNEVRGRKSAGQTEQSTRSENCLRMVLRGTAGSGKTHVIKCFKKVIVRELGIDEAKRRVAFAAPTGTAAFNIRGSTIHALLSLPVNKAFEELKGEKLKELEERLGSLWILVLDERSMLGCRALSWVDSRCQQATGNHHLPFGGITVILVGDDGQLAPIGDSPAWAGLVDDKSIKKPTDIHGRSGMALFSKIDTVITLDEPFRQIKEDPFYQLLLKAREADWNSDQQYNLLATRKWAAVSKEEQDLFEADALRLSPFRADVWEHNLMALDSVGSPVLKIKARHDRGGATAAAASSDEVGLKKTVWVCVGARVMLTANIWTKAGLVNGTMGEIVAIYWGGGTMATQDGMPEAILVRFPEYSGPRFPGLPTDAEWDNVLPITPKTIFFKKSSKSCTVARTQFPIALAWAVTVHKSQGDPTLLTDLTI